ncbi:MAG: transcription antitermination factor NusB [Bacteroidales bacterium]
MNTDDERDNREGAGRGSRERRHRAREAALQMLYQWEVGRASVHEVVRTYWSIERPGEAPLSPPLETFAGELVRGTVEHVQEIDPLIAESAEHWRLERMATIDRLILRLAVYEFLHAADTPRKVVINEALELARTYSSDDAVKFVNGILDGVKRRLDKPEGREPKA